MKEKNYRKLIGWTVLIPKILVMIASSVALYHAYSVNSIIGIIAGMFLTIMYLADVIYFTVVLIRDLIDKHDERSRKAYEEIDKALDCENEVFDLYDEEKKE